ncbi:MAG: Hsp20/alpha crystallin family protein [Flavobacteriaceae bacterium]|nr:Hsp20/alpha crystallin family protein [Flavobacteriaceae bacterium]MBL6692610.1 Hsp20/alpha crystallin family protein [Flavobacteriaceae bacterium]
MNLIKRQNPVFNTLIDDLLLTSNWSRVHDDAPAVNIIEVDDRFDLQLLAPGQKKGDFEIALEEGVLTISSEVEQHSKEDALSFTRREFGYNAFKRAFDVPDSVAVEKISAQYKEGILTVSLPKKEEALPQPKKLISVK